MALEILEVHHTALNMPAAKVDAMGLFYHDVMGMDTDASRWEIKGAPGFFMDTKDDRQLHLLGRDGVSQWAQGPEQDPAERHVAFAVRDIAIAESELKRLGVVYFSLNNAGAPDLRQLFFKDPAGNLLEIHQIGRCRCKASNRAFSDAKVAAGATAALPPKG